MYSSKSEAKANGADRYYTGKPCKHGHISARYVCDHACVECKKITNSSTHPLYETWRGMIKRCYHENHNHFHSYGGRGIEVCERWYDPNTGFLNFVSDMGQRPDGYTLDRIDCDGDYEPSNCRWADANTQVRNRRDTKIKGEDLPKIVEMRKSGMKLKDIAAHYSCVISNISLILSGKYADGKFVYRLDRGAKCAKN